MSNINQRRVIKSADGTILEEGNSGYDMFKRFYTLHDGHRVWWGDHYRVMKRRRDPESLVLKCKDCGHSLHSL